jgi:hypothetical protein
MRKDIQTYGKEHEEPGYLALKKAYFIVQCTHTAAKTVSGNSKIH